MLAYRYFVLKSRAEHARLRCMKFVIGEMKNSKRDSCREAKLLSHCISVDRIRDKSTKLDGHRDVVEKFSYCNGWWISERYVCWFEES